MRAIPKWVEKIHEENEEKEQTGYVVYVVAVFFEWFMKM